MADRCRFSFEELVYKYPDEVVPDGFTTATWLRHITYEGAKSRYRGDIPESARTLLEKELALIDELGYCGYFLTMWELVRFCRENDIICQGRGSAANSVVCYCLGVTSVDPVRMNLLFERFLSRERAEPPDIDLDIEHNRREEVIQHMYQEVRQGPGGDGGQRGSLSQEVRHQGGGQGIRHSRDRAGPLRQASSALGWGPGSGVQGGGAGSSGAVSLDTWSS